MNICFQGILAKTSRFALATAGALNRAVAEKAPARVIAGVVSVCLALGAATAAAAPVPQVVWQTNAHVNAVAFSADGSLVAAGGSDSLASVWRANDGTLLQRVQVGGAKVFSLAIAPDNSSFVTGSGDGGTRLWDMNTGLRRWGSGAGGGRIYALSFCRDGRYFVKSAYDLIGVFDSTTGYGLRFDDGVTSVSGVFSPDDTLVAGAVLPQVSAEFPSSGVAKVYRTSDLAVLHVLTGHSNQVYSVDFSPDGQLLLTTSLDGTARLWRVSDGSLVRVIEGGGGVFGKFSADGKTFFTCDGIGTVDFIPGSGTLKFWRTSNGALLASFDNLGAGPIAVSPAGQYFAYGTNGSLVVAYLPLWIESITHQAGEVTLRWQNGSGLYQVQARESLSTGAWQNLGAPTTNTVFTHTCLSPLFYRVQSLTNAP